ncbi:hypothetical protein [Bacteroides sp. 41_26]|uniref:hypothetical protein n=1 Tax=Bacteroides sp. 41_26 TaxID=1896973 RepID=UPI00259CCEFD|nr:hypothetical protein [Bacteroides sp. 41_26]
MIFIKVFIVVVVGSFLCGYGFRAGKRTWNRLRAYRGPIKRAPEGEYYYTVVGPLIAMRARGYPDCRTFFDDRNYDAGNYFPDKATAEDRIRRLQEFNLEGSASITK